MQGTASRGIGATALGAAVALDEHGKRVWKGRGRESGGASRRFGHMVGAAVNVLLFCLASGPLVWTIPFLTGDFVVPLALIKLSLAATAAVELAFVVYDGAWFRHLARLGLHAIAFAATYSLLSVFPFDFPSEMLTEIMRFGLTFALVAILIGAVVELLQLVFGWIRG